MIEIMIDEYFEPTDYGGAHKKGVPYTRSSKIRKIFCVDFAENLMQGDERINILLEYS